jgi:splicing factor U2AF subunit
MADFLSRIHGTEEDKVNCPFYLKIGSCRHGDACERTHLKPAFSETLLFKHMYQNPFWECTGIPDQEKLQAEFDAFYCDVFSEVVKVGEVKHMVVVENTGEHLTGHVYIMFGDEDVAAEVLQKMQGRFFKGRPLAVEFSPVRDFMDSRCKRFDDQECNRAGSCNFMHIMEPSPALLDYLRKEYGFTGSLRDNRGGADRRGDRDRDDRRGGDRRMDRDRDYDRRGDRRGGRDRDYDRRGDRREDRDYDRRSGERERDPVGRPRRDRSRSRSRDRSPPARSSPTAARDARPAASPAATEPVSVSAPESAAEPEPEAAGRATRTSRSKSKETVPDEAVPEEAPTTRRSTRATRSSSRA